MIQLTLTEAGGKRLEITELPYLVGRTPECALVLESPRVSRKHARFERGEGGLVVVDLGSSNGTFVNGTRLTGPTPLRTGDRVQFGDVVYTVEVPAILAQTIVGGFSVLEALHEQARRESEAAPGSARPEPEEIPVSEVLPPGLDALSPDAKRDGPQEPPAASPTPDVKPTPEAKPTPEPVAEPKLHPEPIVEPNPPPESVAMVKPEPEPIAEPKPAPEAKPAPEPIAEVKPPPEATPAPAPAAEVRPPLEATPAPAPAAEVRPPLEATPAPAPAAEVKPPPDAKPSPEPAAEPKPQPEPIVEPKLAPEPIAGANPAAGSAPAPGTCPGCGRSLPPQSRFCEGCGRQTDGQTTAFGPAIVAGAAPVAAVAPAPVAAPVAAVPVQSDPYAGIEAGYRQLAERKSQGTLSAQEFADQVNNLRHCDDQGRWWQISPHTGKWLFHDGKAWQDGEPPRPAPVQVPGSAPSPWAAAPVGEYAAAAASHPVAHPGSVGPTPEEQPVAGAAVALAPGAVAGGQGVVISPQMIEVVKRAMQLDPEAYRLVAEDGAWTIPGAVLLAVNALLYGKIVMAAFSSVIQIAYIVLFLAGFAGMAALLFHAGNRFTERRPTLLGWARALALAQLPMVANILPLVGGPLAMWGLLTGITAIRGAGGTGWGKAALLGVGVFLAVGLPLSIVSMVVFWLFGVGIGHG
ncbi:MAG: FHA domain-containing protein [Candidatus Riflebacteria bacterium]|nr:FHA domain-containing protein [Candidatus Riflebacteria bacterium]